MSSELLPLQSASIGSIAAAFLKAQKEINHAVLDSANPAFRSRYASLESVIDAVKNPLNANGIIFTQSLARIAADGEPEAATYVITQLTHTSGEWLRSYIPLVQDKPTAQGQGSGITYARRYALQAICGLGADDDDGNQASNQREPLPKPSSSSNQKRPIEGAPAPAAAAAPSSHDTRHDRKAEMQSIGDYRIKFGKQAKGKTLSELGPAEVSQLMQFVKTKASAKFRDSQDAKEFLFFGDAYLRKAEHNELDKALGSNKPAEGDIAPPPDDWMNEPMPDWDKP